MALDSENVRLKKLEYKLKLAKLKRDERTIKWEITKTYFPFQSKIKFNKLLVFICVAVIVAYTVAAIILQKNISMEISPTLTTCVYGFFGTELISMAGIKVFETKYSVQQNSAISDSVVDDEDADTVG